MSKIIDKYIQVKKYKKVCYAILARARDNPNCYFSDYLSSDIKKYLIGYYSKVKYEIKQPDILLYSLIEAECETDIEKIVIIYSHYPNFGKDIKIEKDSIKNSLGRPVGSKKYESGMLFLTRVSKFLTIEETATAVSIITDWHGDSTSFIKMVKSI